MPFPARYEILRYRRDELSLLYGCFVKTGRSPLLNDYIISLVTMLPLFSHPEFSCLYWFLLLQRDNHRDLEDGYGYREGIGGLRCSV
jgi:hypothetical protein